MFDKILIANRGEIAVRIIKTARKMGIKTVAVYSEADTNALHVQEADEAVYIGQSPSVKSYLRGDRIIKAALETGAQAIHPGYGFLSENSEFCKAAEKKGITFIGPGVEAIDVMGDKIKAKQLANKAGVNTVPGYKDAITEFAKAKKIANKIGYPVMIKAAAGGGGKGMRVVHGDKELQEGLRAAASEAKSSFSDDRVFIEKFIEQPRHIEIQILADKHGNVVALGERECSIQRRHQKIIEEAPSPFLDEKTRKAMCKQSIALAKKVDYCSAGTVEFIVDSKKNFYFLEMNTRLQVEHRVTELITGLDLVEQMIRVAAGEKLDFEQKDVQIEGWAMESRIYAEDPSRGFLPSTGRVTRFQEPDPSAYHVLVDTGIYEGGEVSMFYDPMIAKICTYGKDRDEAVEAMKSALGSFILRGISHNTSFLEAIFNHPRFVAGDMSTNFIADEYPDGFAGAELTSKSMRVFIAVALYMHMQALHRESKISGQMPGREMDVSSRWVVGVGKEDFPVVVTCDEGRLNIAVNNEVVNIHSEWELGRRLFQGYVNDEPVNVRVGHMIEGYFLDFAGTSAKVVVRTTKVAELVKYVPQKPDIERVMHLEAPITGLLVEIKVKVGDKVKLGKELVIIEAMKMENVLVAEQTAVISKIHAVAGESVTAGQLLVEFDFA